MLDGGTFEVCKRLQCPKVAPCTLEGCGRPAPDDWVREMLDLYGDCKRRNALPEPGGVLAQQAALMYWFRVIDRIIEQFRQEQADMDTLRGMTHG